MTDFSDVSDAEIAERTARDVMGWDEGTGKWYPPGGDSHTFPIWLDDGERVMKQAVWDPMNDANHRERLKNHAINEYGLTITTWQDPTGQGAEVMVMPYDDELECGDPTRKLASRSGERAICEAILAAVEQQEVDE